MTTALAADVHDAWACTAPADRRAHLLDLAQHVDEFTPYEVSRALAAWCDPAVPPATRAWRWHALVTDVRRLRDLDGLQDRAAYDIAVGVLRADIDHHLHRLTGATL